MLSFSPCGELFRMGNLGPMLFWACYSCFKTQFSKKKKCFKTNYCNRTMFDPQIESQTFLRTSSSSSVRTLQASLSSGLVRGEGCRPSGLWLHSSSDFWPFTMPWECPEDADRWGLLDPTPATGRPGTEVRGEKEKVSYSYQSKTPNTFLF